MTIDEIWNDFRHAKPAVRERIIHRVEQNYGKGFAQNLRDQFETALLWEENEKAMKR